MQWLPESGLEAKSLAAVTEILDPAVALETRSRKRSRVLLADDNADMREYLRRLLGKQYEVLAVADGEAALTALRRDEVDLVITDVMMPRLDGFGLLHAVRADPVLKVMPVILLSAREGEESGVEGLDAGADDYLVKPFTAQELLARVGSALNMARIRREAERELAARNLKSKSKRSNSSEHGTKWGNA
jgi:DNA-binding response OmpR family regulator